MNSRRSTTMAARSFFLTLTRNCSSKSTLCRSLTSTAAGSSFLDEESPYDSQEIDDLKSRILRLRLPKRSAINVIEKWRSEGNSVSVSELRNISKELRKSQRYKHALEISEWMVNHEEIEVSDSDYAVRIDMMTKVFGIDAAERYFEALPLNAKTSETYTALLHSYASAKMTEKAELLFNRIIESNLSFSALTYNEMMTLYMSVGQVEKVSAVVEELNRQNVVPDIFTYNLWISSCAATLNIDEVRRILEEMRHASGSNEDWTRYIDITNIYVTTGHLVNAESNSVVGTEKGITQREWITYDFLIILYAGLGNKDKIDQIWKSLRLMKQKMTSRNYICILSSHLMLGHMYEVGEVIDQWMQSTTTNFDIRVCNRLADTFADVGFDDKANSFRMVLIQKNCDPSIESKEEGVSV